MERGLAESHDDHADLKQRLVGALRAADSQEFAAQVASLAASVLSEFEKERAEILPIVRRLFTATELEQLGSELEGESKALQADGGPPRFHVHLTR